MTKDVIDLWFWPWKAAQANVALAETIAGAPAVIAARLPMIANAMTDPLAADPNELTRMVTEKVDAFGQSHRSVSAAAAKMRAACEANGRDLAKAWRGGLFGPADYARMIDRNLAAWAALATVSGVALAPFHKRVTDNSRRLHKRAS